MDIHVWPKDSLLTSLRGMECSEVAGFANPTVKKGSCVGVCFYLAKIHFIQLKKIVVLVFVLI
jgi:hypothetical protein